MHADRYRARDGSGLLGWPLTDGDGQRLIQFPENALHSVSAPGVLEFIQLRVKYEAFLNRDMMMTALPIEAKTDLLDST